MKTKPRRGSYTPGYAKKFIELSKQGKSVSQIAAEFGVSRRTIYNWKSNPNYPEFKEAFDIGETAREAFHTQLLDDMIQGRIAKNSLIGQMYRMKCMFKETWRDTDSKQHIEITNTTESMDDQQLNQRLMALLKEMGLTNGIRRVK